MILILTVFFLSVLTGYSDHDGPVIFESPQPVNNKPDELHFGMALSPHPPPATSNPIPQASGAVQSPNPLLERVASDGGLLFLARFLRESEDEGNQHEVLKHRFRPLLPRFPGGPSHLVRPSIRHGGGDQDFIQSRHQAHPF